MKTLLITPPMTQLNTPYPASAYLSGFLRQQGYASSQRDMSIDLFLHMLSPDSLQHIYQQVEIHFADVDDDQLPDSIFHFFAEFDKIQRCLPATLSFLQGKDPAMAMRIASRRYLVEGPAFAALHDMDEHSAEALHSAFGELGIQDKAKYIATLFINDVVAVIQQGVDPLFEVSRYAERLAASNPSFDDLHQQLHTASPTLVRKGIHRLAEHYLASEQPDIIAITVPFPGNMLGALQIAQSCKTINPQLKIILGGGYVNTELRSLSEPRLFEYVDFVTLDKGEQPLLSLLQYLHGQIESTQLLRTYYCRQNTVTYQPGNPTTDIPFDATGCPTYDGLDLDNYLSLCEMLNPMHRLWSDGHWNKLTVAHGCYWKKCSFCDISLDYIADYQPASINILIDRIEHLITATGRRGFHFVDEAAPPKTLFALARALIDRNIVISWWGNIRFEKSFTAEKCQLLADSGCIAVSGGLEVASDRLLKLMQKGVTVSQVAQVTHAFAQAGILVHAYLMYGFPTQTENETVESLEWVRQMMLNGCFRSAYWHRFAATVHSPVGLTPDHFDIQLIANTDQGFAQNDINYIDPVATDHSMLGQGLNKATYNYMHGSGFEYPVNFWFDEPLAEPQIDPDFIAQQLHSL